MRVDFDAFLRSDEREKGTEHQGGCCGDGDVDRSIELKKTHTKKTPKTSFFPSGPFCHRVLLAAGEKQVPLTLGYVDFASKPDW